MVRGAGGVARGWGLVRRGGTWRGCMAGCVGSAHALGGLDLARLVNIGQGRLASRVRASFYPLCTGLGLALAALEAG